MAGTPALPASLPPDYISAEKLATAGDMWEEYLVGPDSESDPAKWQTRIVFPLA
ncbi:hypothetical protein [Cryobacterium mannosilyticum]|uniref:hypothetical protein n=1 Tax=Cryobacterium mannosilyticum TaxID=1259190 RepID=UPI00141A7DEC|nr:hypothetical protein [Cryobacterium mannosilyticum]